MTKVEKALTALKKSDTHSEAIKSGIQQSMQAGKVKLNYSQFLGYTKDADGNLIIVPKEAEVVRKIFDLYLQGNGCRKIKRWLEEHNVKTVTGKSEWSTSTIDRILSSEKYVGDVLLQKTFTPDCLSGIQVRNVGQQAMYYIENNHEPIIDRETWLRAQEMKGVPLPEYMRIDDMDVLPETSEEASSGFEMKTC